MIVVHQDRHVLFNTATALVQYPAHGNDGQPLREYLMESQRHKYFLVQCQGDTPTSAAYLTDLEAVAWLLNEGHPLPDGLQACDAAAIE